MLGFSRNGAEFASSCVSSCNFFCQRHPPLTLSLLLGRASRYYFGRCCYTDATEVHAGFAPPPRSHSANIGVDAAACSTPTIHRNRRRPLRPRRCLVVAALKLPSTDLPPRHSVAAQSRRYKTAEKTQLHSKLVRIDISLLW
jgi:hypothetical protein